MNAPKIKYGHVNSIPEESDQKLKALVLMGKKY